ncbi:hypothetical protein NIES267_71400 (plasmid) [Calothrix parasitica NIES-267]|uniref:Uncharacterized protein n=1 Tax=Calothrix parasitica NIES-267 TaxID=1973488 RepID=A0A1Z4M2C4_9CYAN|nr:hypothetical protein NIES267_71400 [Calothrix parasitica NIES-267]
MKQNRTQMVRVLFNQNELEKLKHNAKNSRLSTYLRKLGLREQQIVNSDDEIRLKSSLAEIRYQLSQLKVSILCGEQPNIETINKIIQISDNL